jgi:predicted DNA binding protein
MPSGIRAELAFEDLETCGVAGLLEDGADADSISWSVGPESGRVTEEFTLEDDREVPGATEVFSTGERSIFRFQRDHEECCPCESVQKFDVPVRDIHMEDGTLFLAIHVEDMDELRDILVGVRAEFPDVRVVRLVHAEEAGAGDLVLVDRGDLTERQRQVLETAHEMGYFDHPKGANAGEIADQLDITTSTFTEHLSAAQSKLLTGILS